MRNKLASSVGAYAVVGLSLCACSTEASNASTTPRGNAGSTGSGGSVSSGSNTGSAGLEILLPTIDAGMEAGVIETLPEGFTQADIGGFLAGEELGVADASSPPDGNSTCANVLLGVVRDFVGGTSDPSTQNPDFQGSLYGMMPTLGLVGATLDATQKPTYTARCEKGSTNATMTLICPYQAETTTKVHFDQWYNYTTGINRPYIVRFWFAPQGNGLFTFDSTNFFPIDNLGFGNTTGEPSPKGEDGKEHNFSFTTELHTQFSYAGGELFTFTGDDDIWVFINGHLAVDLGGLHLPATKTINLDNSATTLGITVGGTYNLDLFHAERHDPGSHFRIDTNLSFVNCGTVPDDVK